MLPFQLKYGHLLPHPMDNNYRLSRNISWWITPLKGKHVNEFTTKKGFLTNPKIMLFLWSDKAINNWFITLKLISNIWIIQKKIIIIIIEDLYNDLNYLQWMGVAWSNSSGIYQLNHIYEATFSINIRFYGEIIDFTTCFVNEIYCILTGMIWDLKIHTLDTFSSGERFRFPIITITGEVAPPTSLPSNDGLLANQFINEDSKDILMMRSSFNHFERHVI